MIKFQVSDRKMESVHARIDDPNSNVNDWVRFGLKLGVQSLLHPFEYSKVLIQVIDSDEKTLFTFVNRNSVNTWE